MKTIFRYPGAKTKLLKHIAPRLETWLCSADLYVEPFVGGGSVLLDVAERYPELPLRVNDFDPLVSSFWALVASGTERDDEEFIRLLHTEVTVEKFFALRDGEPAVGLVDRAYRAVYINRTAFSGIYSANPIGGLKQESEWSVDCRYNAERLTEGYKEIVKLLRGRLEVSSLDFVAFLAQDFGEAPVFYLDPPYFVVGPRLYAASMEPRDHVILALILRGMRRWLLSYDNAPEIQELYKNATIEGVKGRYSIQGRKETWDEKVELLISPK